MDVPTSIEQTQFFWGMAFVINLMMATALFVMIVRRTVPAWASGALMWIAWWTMANALSLVINVVLGPDNTFSYHQMGILTESMVNLGVSVWALSYLIYNWNLSSEKKWKQMDALRRQLSMEVDDDSEQ